MKKKKYKLAIFDLDGTLLDTSQGVLNAAKAVIIEKGWIMPNAEILRSFIGPPIQDSFAKHYKLTEQDAKEAAGVFRKYYKEKHLLEAISYDGIYDTFDFLISQGIKVAVATYKREDYAQKVLCHFGFDKYTELLYGSDFEGKLKKVDIIKKVIHDSNVQNYEEIVMIGDSYHDALGAEQIPVDFIGVTYGFDFRTKEDVYQYPAVGWADSPPMLDHYFSS